ncbi:MAG: WD40 repeat domain-containing protein [Candidatus Sigynarchaeota archaeon]
MRVLDNRNNRGAWDISSVDISRDDELVHVMLGYGVSAVWELHSGRKICTIDDKNCLGHGVFTPDGMCVVEQRVHFDGRIGLATGDLVAWNARTGSLAWSLKGIVYSPGEFAFFPREQYIVTSSSSLKCARVWSIPSFDMDTIPELITVLEGHSDSVIDVAVSPDERRVATTSSDKTARIWSLAGSPLDFRGPVHLGEDDVAF